jgi:hypothetical protein
MESEPVRAGKYGVLASGKAVGQRLRDCGFDDGMTQRPAVLENFIFELLGVLEVESGLRPSKRDLTSDYSFNFLQDFQAILYHELYSPLRQIVHLLSADPEEGLEVEFVDTHEPRLFPGEESDTVGLLLIQKLVQRKRGAVGVAKIPDALFPRRIDAWRA